MKKICAWCGKDLEPLSSFKKTEVIVSHGICYNCASKVYEEMGVKELDNFLESIEAPVMIVDKEGIYRTCNRMAQSMLNKDLSQIKGHNGGYVFECAYSGLPGGCGNNVHCDGCTIRRTVMDTIRSGKSHLKVPASLDRGTPDNFKRLDFLISTEKLNDIVLLRIDQPGRSMVN